MALREFEDEQGRMWTAWDVDPGEGQGFRADYKNGWICFESGEEKRRLTPVPGSWDRMSPDDLRMMLHSAVPVVQPHLPDGEGFS